MDNWFHISVALLLGRLMACVITGLSSVRECKYDYEHWELEMMRGLRVTKTFCAGIKTRTIQRCKGKTRLLAANNSKKLIHTVQLNLRTTFFFFYPFVSSVFVGPKPFSSVQYIITSPRTCYQLRLNYDPSGCGVSGLIKLSKSILALLEG